MSVPCQKPSSSWIRVALAFMIVCCLSIDSQCHSAADPKCARGGGVSHILAEKRGVSFTLLKKMHENAIFSPIRGGGGGVRPMLDPPLFLVSFSPFLCFWVLGPLGAVESR